MPDARAICEWIERGSLFLSGMHSYSGFQTAKPKTPGGGRRGGYIGLGKPEKNLVHRGFEAILVEMVIKSWLHSIRKWQEGRLKRHGVRLALNDGVAGFQTGATRC